MNNIQKAFKTKAKRGLCMAVGGVLDPVEQNSRAIAAPVIQGNSDLIQNPTPEQPSWSGGFKSMDFDPQANLNSLSPTNPASAPNPAYGGRFGNDPHFSTSTSRVIQDRNLGKPRATGSGYIPAQQNAPAPNLMTPVDQLFQERRGLQLANGGVAAETPEQVMARMAAKYGVSAAPAATPNPPVTPAPAPVAQPAQPSGGLFQGAVRTLRGRAAQIDKATGYAQGGMVVADGGRSRAPTADSVPVNLSHGEAVLPVKTVAALGGPDAVEHMIESTNGKPTATRGLRAGGNYGVGVTSLPNGGNFIRPEPLETPEQLAQNWNKQPVTVGAPTTPPTAVEARAARAAVPQPTAPAAPAAPAADMAPPLEIPAAQPKAAEPAGAINKAKRGISKAYDSVASYFRKSPEAVAKEVAAKEAASRPITSKARELGKIYAEKGPVGVARDVGEAVNVKANTRTARWGSTAGAALQVGDHFDAFNPDPGWDFERGKNTSLTPVEKAQILLRDAGVVSGGLAGGAGGATVGGVVGSTAGPVGSAAGAVGGGVYGAVQGASAADSGMGYLRRGANWVNEKLGGAPNYWEDTDALIQRSRDFQKQRGIKEGNVQRVSRGVNEAVGTVLDNIGLIDRHVAPETPSDPVQDKREAARHAGAARDAEAFKKQQSRQLGGAPMTFAPAPIAAAQADVPNAPPANDIQRRSIRTPDGRTQTEFYGKDVKQTYTGADGKPTTDWKDTKDYKEAIERNKSERRLLNDITGWNIDREVASSNPAWRERGLARQKVFNEKLQRENERAQTDTDRNYKAADIEMRREDLGLRRAQEARALASAQRQMQREVIEEGRKSDEASMKKQDNYHKYLESVLTMPFDDGKGNTTNVPDAHAIADFTSKADATVAAMEQATRGTAEHSRWVDPQTKKPKSAADLDDTQKNWAINRYKAYQRVKQAQKGWAALGYADKFDTDDLSLLDGVEEGAHIAFPKLKAKLGFVPKIQKKDLAYSDGPIGVTDLQLGKTPSNTLIDNILGR